MYKCIGIRHIFTINTALNDHNFDAIYMYQIEYIIYIVA